MEERGEAAGGLGAAPRRRPPATEDDEVADEVDGREHRQERQEHGLHFPVRGLARRGDSDGDDVWDQSRFGAAQLAASLPAGYYSLVLVVESCSSLLQFRKR